MVIAPPSAQSGMKSQTLPAERGGDQQTGAADQTNGEHRPGPDGVEHAP